ELAEQAYGCLRFLVRGCDRQDPGVAELLGGAALDEVLHADERRAVAGGGEQLGGVRDPGVQPPAERRVCEAQNARGLRVHAGVERRAAGAALRRGTEAGGEANAAGG